MRINITRVTAVLATLLLPSLALSQSSDAVLVGIVQDSSGAALPASVVTAVNSATGLSRQVVTNESGSYQIAPLTPGTYELRTTRPGFKTSVRTGVVLQTGATLKLDLTLDLGDVSERIEVTAVAPMLQTQETSVGSVITTQQLERIPVNGRNYTRLLVLMPGTSDIRRSQGRGDLSGSQMVSVNGQRTQDNNYSIDGVDNNIMFMNSPGGSPPMDAIQEFRVATGNSAEYGRSAGANVNLAIKSGSRNLHGSIYEYLRNDKLDANTFFANRQGQGKIPFRQNQYGVSVGGPAVIPKVFDGRNSTFWFFSWEGFRWRRGQTVQNPVPIAAMRNGDFSSLSTPL
ncbi:MAG: carboxypeptidase regulatory-like domain-containing protein, partial [Bryobacteraceae bacterium]|nr:carboxypeptidase regulatory-like domain-containing protein [Bryobacteraceae bacterium]